MLRIGNKNVLLSFELWFIIFIEKLYAFASISFKINYFQQSKCRFFSFIYVFTCNRTESVSSSATRINLSLSGKT